MINALQQLGMELERKDGAVIAFRHGDLTVFLFSHKKGLPAAVAGQAFHLVISGQKIRRVAAVGKDGLDVFHDALQLVHWSFPPSIGRPRFSRMISVSSRLTRLCRQ